MRFSKSFLATCLVCFFMPGMAISQGYAFKVLVNKGENEVKSGSSWASVKVGASLQATDELKLGQNSYIGMVHASGRSLELKQAGVHKVSELAGQLKGGSSVLNKYTDFILSENSKPKSTLTATGAVHRGAQELEVYLPYPARMVVHGPQVTLHWNVHEIEGPYVVSLSSMFGDELDVIHTSDSILTVDIYDKPFVKEDNILVEISSKSDPGLKSQSVLLKKISRADKDRIQKELGELEKNIDATAMGSYLKAGFFISHKLYIDAIREYIQAIQLAPDVEAYSQEYEAFLLQNGMKGSAVKVGE